MNTTCLIIPHSVKTVFGTGTRNPATLNGGFEAAGVFLSVGSGKLLPWVSRAHIKFSVALLAPPVSVKICRRIQMVSWKHQAISIIIGSFIPSVSHSGPSEHGADGRRR